MTRLTEKMLQDWAGPRKYAEGRALFERESIEDLVYEPPEVHGTIQYGNRALRTGFRLLADGTAESRCPCYDSTERGIICSHVVALAMALHRQLNDPDLVARREQEQRRAARLAAFDEAAYIRRARPGDPDAVPAQIALALPEEWAQRAAATGRFPVRAAARYDGRDVPLEEVPRDLPLTLGEKDEAILFVLEDMCDGPARGAFEVGTADFLNLLSLLEGRTVGIAGRAEPATVNGARMASRLRVRFDAETGELALTIHTELPFAGPEEPRVYAVHRNSGWVYAAGHFWPLERVLPAPLHGIYRRAVVIPRLSVPRFLQGELPALEAHLTVEADVTADLFTIEPAHPTFRLVVRGSEASLSAMLYAEYDGTALVAGKADPAGHFAIPDPDDLMRFTVRNHEIEMVALGRIERLGFGGARGDALSPIIGCREVLNFLARDLPLLRRRGWKVEVHGRIADFLENASYATPVVRVRDVGPGAPAASATAARGGNGRGTPPGAPVAGSGVAGWFEVSFDFEDTAGRSLSAAQIQRALLKGDSYVEVDGKAVLFDGGAIADMRAVFEDCGTGEGSRPGSFRLSAVYAPYVKASLDGLDGVDVEADAAWRQTAEHRIRGAGDEPLTLPQGLDGVLRPYQSEGVRWLRFLEQCGFCGILADEMGLGKTVQTLAWLRLARLHPDAGGAPSLIVCPTSLVENWAEEVTHFVPDTRVLLMSGSDRHERWDALDAADLVVTSYALLRRDIERYRDRRFAVVALDEAQHIKNRSTQNAIAAKSLRAWHRLVLTGTPMENSVSDLWSIMDFLMPGYLGGHDLFRRRYELPIAAGGEEGEQAQGRLRRKLQPFLLRRLKREVARELPPKIQRIAHCTLTGDQQAVYKELLEASRRRIADLVAEQGVAASRMEVLKTLLRLRQTCCHLELLKRQGLRSRYPSAKLDLLFELLDEAIDGGHRVLVFSQFVSMLTILRRELDARELRYCYLDGSTQERMQEVRRFNTQREIPLFLISLKAGGTGLNLTGADMVVHFDPWWNPAVEDQATDRAYRIGQKRTVYSVKMIARDTVEEKVLELQRRKQALIDATVTSDEQVLGRMDWDDIREILDL